MARTSITLSAEAVELNNTLAKAAATFPEFSKDQEFASSLCGAIQRYGRLSEKQAYWAQKLIAKANSPRPVAEVVPVGNFAPIAALFDKAAEKLKSPCVALTIEGIGEVRLSRAGNGSKVPGSINVATPGGFGNNTWFGRILSSGVFEKSGRNEVTTALVSTLQAFAADPAKVAAEHGKLMGKCSMCRLPLSDPRSLEVGYGKICSQKWHLPWGH